MTEGQRPGGLTALAVLNFGLAGWGVLGIFGLIALFAISQVSDPDNDVAMKLKQQWEKAGLGPAFLLVIAAIYVVSVVLLIVSGVGYLKLKKFLGRTLGNGYALLSIGTSIVSVAFLPDAPGGGVSLATIVGLIYPVVTLILLNTTFKEDFIY